MGKNNYPKTEPSKYLELINLNKIRQFFNTASKMLKFPGRASSNSIVDTFQQI